MAEQPKTLDVSDVPDVLSLAEEVHRAGEPTILQCAGVDLAVIIPLPQPGKRQQRRALSKADYEAFRSAAGGWHDIDTDKLIENIYESRRLSIRPPIDL